MMFWQWLVGEGAGGRTWHKPLVLLVIAALAGCAGAPEKPQPREVMVAVEPQQVLSEGLQVLLDRGFVIRHADLDLGRLDAVLATWPGYRLRLYALSASEGKTRLSLSGYRARQPLAAESLDTLLAELQARLSTNQ